MKKNAVPELDPVSLPVGAVVGPWRVEGWAGRGSYGVVYRAVRVGQEEAGLVALKLAMHPEDPRFEREVTLLSRLRHPNVPRYLGHGSWRSPAGTVHPYLAMQWVQGSPLYDWSAERNPSSRRVLRVLAQAARALEAVHAAGAVHRDVKGANLLVRRGDGRVFLSDFGTGHYAGAATLTPKAFVPGTPAYQSPEAWRFPLRFLNAPAERYESTAADDLFALGVAAYRLVTDEYPPSPAPMEDTAGLWREGGAGPKPPVALNPRVVPRLNELILRLLSLRPETRGSAAQLEALSEEAAEQLGPEADFPLFEWDAAITPESQQCPRRRDRKVVRQSERRDAVEKAELERQEAEDLARARARTEQDPERTPRSPWMFRLIALAAGVLLMVGSWWLGARYAASSAWGERGGLVGLVDELWPLSVPATRAASRPAGIRKEVPPEPSKNQLRPPCARGLVEIQRGCWTKLEERAPDCPQNSYEWKGGCYMPILSLQPPATSEQP